MSDTPRTDAEFGNRWIDAPDDTGVWMEIGFPRRLERENAELREKVAEAAAMLTRMIPALERELDSIPKTHEGSCGPWNPCDGNCEAAAYIAEDLAKAQAFIKRLSSEKSPSTKEAQ